MSVSVRIKRQVFRWLATVLGERSEAMALPKLTGPAKGLWFRAVPTDKKTENAEIGSLAKICQPGWTIWDCASSSHPSSILFARFVGEQGFVVAFEPDRSEFLKTYDNATLNGITNILFLFASIGRPSPKTFGPPVKARRMSLDEAYEDDEIPVPQLIRVDLDGECSEMLSFSERLIREQKPVILVEKCSDEGFENLSLLASQHAYTLWRVSAGGLIPALPKGQGIIVATPAAA